MSAGRGSMAGMGGASNPFGDMMQNMFGSMMGAGKSGAGQGGAFDPGEIIDALFTAGKKTQDANTEAMTRIFEQFTGGRK